MDAHRTLPSLLAILAVALAAAAVAPAHGQDDAAVPGGDPPTRAARLGYIEGAVSLQPAGVEDWTTAPLNQPLAAGDALWSDSGARAEVDLGSALVRLDERSSVNLVDLSDQGVQWRLNGGAMEIDVASLAPGEVDEIDAPNAAVALLRPGEYRLSVDEDGNTSVAIRSGQAQVISGEQQTTNLVTGQRGLFGADGSYAVAPAGAPDDFDLWCARRQAHWTQEQAVAQYVSSDAVGYEDLADYGEWQAQPEYGYVWFPTQVAADWVPYSSGHWVWVAPWGWNWVDDAPWGFAPFHYGRWTHIGARWAWIPAPPRRHAVYAPALVAWVGGSAVSLGGGAAVGWLALAPGEVYVPAYRASSRYLLNVNLSNAGGLNAAYVASVGRNPALQTRYANRAIPRAMTVMAQSNFAAGQPVARHAIAPPPQFVAAVPAARAPSIIHGRESVLGPVALTHVARPPPATMARPTMVHRQAPAATSFQPQGAAVPARAAHPEVPSPATEPNVFKRRDEELRQQHEAQLREQRDAQLRKQQLQQQHRQTQLLLQQRQRQLPQREPEMRRQEPQRPVAAPSQPEPQPQPKTQPKTQLKRGESPPPASEQR